MLASREKLMEFAARDVKGGARRADVEEMLLKNGMPADEAAAVLNQLYGAKSDAAWTGAAVGISIGFVLILIGVGATLASGGRSLYYGAIVAGVLAAGRGVAKLLG
ncbi:MAG: hypothetical protein ABMA64_42560 [Myxococcota bacterium]